MSDQSPIHDRLLEYAYGELDPVQSKEVERQIAGDARLAEELAKVRGVRAVVASLPRPMPRADITATILKRGMALVPRKKSKLAWASVFWRPAFAAAAGLVLVLGVGLYIVRSGSPDMLRESAPTDRFFGASRSVSASSSPASPPIATAAAPAPAAAPDPRAVGGAAPPAGDAPADSRLTGGLARKNAVATPRAELQRPRIVAKVARPAEGSLFPVRGSLNKDAIAAAPAKPSFEATTTVARGEPSAPKAKRGVAEESTQGEASGLATAFGAGGEAKPEGGEKKQDFASQRVALRDAKEAPAPEAAAQAKPPEAVWSPPPRAVAMAPTAPPPPPVEEQRPAPAVAPSGASGAGYQQPGRQVIAQGASEPQYALQQPQRELSRSSYARSFADSEAPRAQQQRIATRGPVADKQELREGDDRAAREDADLASGRAQVEALLAKAERELAASLPDAAIRTLEQLLRQNPGYSAPRIFELFAQAYDKKGNAPQAYEYRLRAQRAKPAARPASSK